MTLRQSTIAGTANNGVTINSGPSIRITLHSATINANAGTGVLSQGVGSETLVHQSAITHNGTGVLAAGGGTLTSFSSNVISGNTTNGTPTSTVASQ